MNEATKQIFAKLYLQKASSDDYLDWAITCLKEGLDSKNLRMLAATEKPFYPAETDERFRRALAELGISFPNEREFLLYYAKDVARKIVSKEIYPAAGLNEIHNIDISLDYPDELKAWTLLDGGYDPETNEWIGESYHYPSIHSQKWFEITLREAKKLVASNG